ncbi:MAG TPA: hypothetical protein DD490_22470 [Acidobacteria bacterium]|nr:hypothetical protein [Acidobacteriota bacterium]
MRLHLTGMVAAVLLAACQPTARHSLENAAHISPMHPDCAAIRSAGAEDPPATDPVPVPFEGSRLRVLALGDFGDGSADQEAVADAMAAYQTLHRDTPISFGLTLGDNFYSEGLQDRQIPWKELWEDKYAQLGFLFFASLGNHDYSDATPEQELAYSSQSWCLPRHFYTFTAGPVQFFALDTQPLVNSRGDEQQLAWLDKALGQSQARWKVVYGHHPILSNGSHGDDPEIERLRNRLLPRLRGRATLYLTGHDHDLQRLMLDGVHLVIAGAGGHDVRPLRLTPSAGQWGVGKTPGFAVLEASDQQLTIQLIDKNQNALCTLNIHQDGGFDNTGCRSN